MAGGSLIERLVAQAESRLRRGSTARVHILVGALSNISPAALQRQFERATAGSALAGVELVFHLVGDPLSPDALAVRVIDVDFAV
jgi:Zn finger protein HypA/HybF involved in hydrogenase expression